MAAQTFSDSIKFYIVELYGLIVFIYQKDNGIKM